MVELNEAYGVLGQISSRRRYDFEIEHPFSDVEKQYRYQQPFTENQYQNRYQPPGANNANSGFDPFTGMDRSADWFYYQKMQEKGYYGFWKIPRQSNARFLMVMGVFVGMVLFLHWLQYKTIRNWQISQGKFDTIETVLRDKNSKNSFADFEERLKIIEKMRENEENL